MRRLLAVGFLFAMGFLVGGCASARLTPVKGPDGQEWVAISCSHGTTSCWEAAADVCPSGYETVDEVQTTHGFLFAKHSREEMLIRCTRLLPAARAEHAVTATPAG
jgi:hypothetical protein